MRRGSLNKQINNKQPFLFQDDWEYEEQKVQGDIGY